MTLVSHDDGTAWADGNGKWRSIIWDGDVDVARVPAMLARTFAGAYSKDHVVVDLSEVCFLDSAGLGVLVQARVLLRAQGGDLLVRNPSPMVRWMFAYFDFDDLIEPAPDVAPVVSQWPGSAVVDL